MGKAYRRAYYAKGIRRTDSGKANDTVFYGYMTLEQGALSGKYDAEHPFPEGSARAKVFNLMLPQIGVITAELKKIAGAHGVSAAQIATAYAVNKGVLPMVITSHAYRRTTWSISGRKSLEPICWCSSRRFIIMVCQRS